MFSPIYGTSKPDPSFSRAGLMNCAIRHRRKCDEQEQPRGTFICGLFFGANASRNPVPPGTTQDSVKGPDIRCPSKTVTNRPQSVVDRSQEQNRATGLTGLLEPRSNGMARFSIVIFLCLRLKKTFESKIKTGGARLIAPTFYSLTRRRFSGSTQGSSIMSYSLLVPF